MKKLLLSDGHLIPNFAFGSGTVFYQGKVNNEGNRKSVPELVECTLYALENGFNHLDCAEMYGNEQEVGEALEKYLTSGKKREDIFVCTKVDPENSGDIDKIKESLRRLKLDYVDLFLIHSPFKIKTEEIEITWKKMENIVKLSLAKSIGVSNYQINDLKELLKVCTIKPVFNQIEFHPYLQQRELIDFCHQNKILVSAYGTQMPIVHDKEGPLTTNNVISNLSKKYNQPEGNILLRWASQKIDVVVTTSTKKTRIDEQLKTFYFELSSEDVDEISKQGESHLFRKYWVKNLDVHGNRL
jgi:diketogulonate reductase-like aldo/keto reductase